VTNFLVLATLSRLAGLNSICSGQFVISLFRKMGHP
jgi:hypothetical protein